VRIVREVARVLKLLLLILKILHILLVQRDLRVALLLLQLSSTRLGRPRLLVERLLIRRIVLLLVGDSPLLLSLRRRGMTIVSAPVATPLRACAS
jgi:hypothetical protein